MKCTHIVFERYCFKLIKNVETEGEWAFEVFWTESHITQDPDVI